MTEGVEGRSSDYNMIRYQQYKYVEYESGEKELYDLSADPFELESQHDTADPALLADLQRRLDALATCAAETCRIADSAP